MVKVTCLHHHTYMSGNTRHVVRSHAQAAKGILSNLLININECEKCNAKAVRPLVVLHQSPAVPQV